MTISITTLIPTLIALIIGVLIGVSIGTIIYKNKLKYLISINESDQNSQTLILEEKLHHIEYLYEELLQNSTKSNIELVKHRDNNLSLCSENAALKERLTALDKLSAEINIEKMKSEELIKHNIELEKNLSHLKAINDKEKKVSEEKLKILSNAQQTLTKEFENISNRIFENKRKIILEQNRDNLSAIISPLKEQLKDFKHKVEEVYEKESKDRISLYHEITTLKELNTKIGKDAINLTNALKGDHKTQGAWGEILLEKVLEDSGLRKGFEYETQFSSKDKEGQTKRPDVVVRLPDNKDVVIDSKVTLNAYEKYHSTDNSDEKISFLKEFINNIKNHINDLSNKQYEELPEIRTLDYVLMFIPIEGAFMTAIESDRKLFSNAFQKSIVLVSPATLLVVLKTIQSIWRYEHQNRNARDIADRAGKLYDKFTGLIESFKNVGRYLEKADKEFHNSFKLLSEGRGNLISQVENIKKLGLKTKKQLPNDLLINGNEVRESEL